MLQLLAAADRRGSYNTGGRLLSSQTTQAFLLWTSFGPLSNHLLSNTCNHLAVLLLGFDWRRCTQRLVGCNQ